MNVWTFPKVIVLVAVVVKALETKPGRRVGQFLPTPFWIYFISILASTFHLLPRRDPSYGWISFHLLPTALILLLIGAPILLIIKLGPRALAAMGLGTGSMFIAVVLSYAAVGHWMGGEGWKSAGVMLGTWTGGSANMLSVKEILAHSDAGLGPLIVADTFLSYGWMAFLMLGVAYQSWFDKNLKNRPEIVPLNPEPPEEKILNPKKFPLLKGLLVLFFGFFLAELMGEAAVPVEARLGFISVKAWVILFSTTSALLLALTKLSRMEAWGASKYGAFLLYVVLASIGAKTNLAVALESAPILIFGGLVMVIHGSLLFGLGRFFQIPLFLLATASQANVGGPISAPIVAGVYRRGAAHLGVLMAIAGAAFGTYVGALGGWVCRIVNGLIFGYG